MYRLVIYTEKEAVGYLQETASETIAGGLRYVYDCNGSGHTFFQDIMGQFAERNFFEGLSQYIFRDDNDSRAGEKLVLKKAGRMLEKVEDPGESYTFDVFEELLFYMAIMYCRNYLRLEKDPQIYDPEREKAAVSELMEKYRYPEKEAVRTGRAVTKFHEMNLKKNQDKNMFFWDNDYAFIFREGFVKGIQILKGAAGEYMGYGYDYACEIFTDIGLEVPLKLLGTKEANRTVNALIMSRMRSGIKREVSPDLK